MDGPTLHPLVNLARKAVRLVSETISERKYITIGEYPHCPDGFVWASFKSLRMGAVGCDWSQLVAPSY